MGAVFIRATRILSCAEVQQDALSRPRLSIASFCLPSRDKYIEPPLLKVLVEWRDGMIPEANWPIMMATHGAMRDLGFSFLHIKNAAQVKGSWRTL